MRMVLPETKKKEFNREEFRDYLFKFHIVGGTDPIPFRMFLEVVLATLGQEEGLEFFMKMLPVSYQYMAEDIIREDYNLERPISENEK
jgi:hypothetical protein